MTVASVKSALTERRYKRNAVATTALLLLILVHHLEIGVHNIAFLASGLRRFRRRFRLWPGPTGGRAGRGLLARLRIDVRRNRMPDLGQLLLSGLHRVEVFAFERVLD